MTPYEVRLELLKLAADILQKQAAKPEDMPTGERVVAEADKLNQFVSNKQA